MNILLRSSQDQISHQFRPGEAWVNLNLNKPLEQNPVTTNKFNANIFSSMLMLSTWSKNLRKTQLDHYQPSKVKWLLELVNLYTSFHIWRRKWQPTPVVLPGKSHGWRSLVQATVHGVAKSRTRLSDFTSLHFHIYNFHHSGSNHHYLLSRPQSGLSATIQSSLVHSPSE